MTVNIAETEPLSMYCRGRKPIWHGVPILNVISQTLCHTLQKKELIMQINNYANYRLGVQCFTLFKVGYILFTGVVVFVVPNELCVMWW